MKRNTKWLMVMLLAAGMGTGGMGWAWAQGSGPLAAKAAAEIRFLDISDHWAAEQVNVAVQKGYVNGYEDGTFKPDILVTRAEFVKMAVTALDIKVSGTTTGAEWYMPYVKAAVDAGIHQWSDLNTGDWNTPMTRYEMSRMADRAAGQSTDEDKKWMYLATKAGLIQGMDDTGTLAEDGTTTRAQAVTIIERILDVKAGKTLEADKHAVSRAEVVWHKTNIFTVMPQYFGKPYVQWNPNDLFVETPDGLYRGELDALIAIDLADANDPFLSALPEISTLKWHNRRVDHKGRDLGYPISDYMDNYVLYFKGREVFRKDSNLYADWGGFVPYTIMGQKSPDVVKFVNGELNDPASIFVNQLGDVPAFIIPKKLQTDGSLGLELYSPSRPPHTVTRKRILMSQTPAIIE